MARGGRKKSSKKASPSRGTKRAKAKQNKQRRHEKALSKKLGYSVTYSRQKRERAASKKYVETAKKLSAFVPELKTLSKKSRLSSADKGKITKRSKQLRHVLPNLYVIPKKDRKALKGLEFAPGVNAIALRLTSSDATIKTDGKDLIVTSNGRTWIYWRLDKATVRNKKGQLEEAAKKAFEAKFPLEVVAQLAEKAFKELKVKSVTLWTTAGRADQTFGSLNQFLRWLHSKMQAGRYTATHERADGTAYETASDAGDFINGLAILLEEPKQTKKKK